MDCLQIRQQVSVGQENRQAVRKHLKDCEECQEFRQRMQEVDTLLCSALPFSAPQELSYCLLAMVPQAAQYLQARAARQAEEKRSAQRLLFQQTLYLLLGVALFLAISFWPQILAFLQFIVVQVRELLPLLPAALRYWGGRLVSMLIPILESLWVIASFVVLALFLEYTLRVVRGSSATARPQH